MTVAHIYAGVPVLENARLAQSTYRLRVGAPDLASAIAPGQFVMLRIPGTTDPLLGRPFALYDTVLDVQGKPVGVDIVYLVVGKMTGRLAEMKVGDRLDVCGPLGNGFPPLTEPTNMSLVAGGIGQTPFLAYIRELLGSRDYGRP